MIVRLAASAYNGLHLGQIDLTGEIAPICHTAKRTRVWTVLQEIMCLAAELVARARRFILDFGRGVPVNVDVFVMFQNCLMTSTSAG
ncbi:MAG: hypothetical protein ACK443_10130 [Methylococcaceae bacterium]